MAEFDVGAHCSYEGCNCLDFLPIHCLFCDRIFCKLHSSVTSHQCSQIDATVEPSLDQFSKTQTSEADCVCQFEDCKQRQLVLLICEACHGRFCIAHKQKETHKCPVLENLSGNKDMKLDTNNVLDFGALESVSHPLITSNQASGQANSVAASSQKATATMVRLNLIKTKMHAIPGGHQAKNVVEADRFYLRLVPSDDLVPKPTDVPAYFGKHWPLGRVLDFACDHFNLNRIFTQKKQSPALYDSQEPTRCLDLSSTLDEAEQSGKLYQAQTLTIGFRHPI